MNSQDDLRQRGRMDRRTFVSMVAAGAASTLFQGNAAAAQPASRNVVLVHGLFADGSSWSEVIARLQAAGLNVASVQNPLTTLPEAVASAERVLARPNDSRRSLLLRHDRHGGRDASERLSARLRSGAGAGCRRGLHGARQDLSDATGLRRNRLRRR